MRFERIAIPAFTIGALVAISMAMFAGIPDIVRLAVFVIVGTMVGRYIHRRDRDRRLDE